MRRKAVLAAALVALLVLGLATTAAANWTHKGKGELKENASLTFSGELTLSTSAGNVACPTSIGTTLTASGSAGHVNSFTVSEPSKCDLTGSLAAICGTNGLTKVEKTGTWALTADETDITMTSIDVHYVLAGCLIPSFRLKGSATLSLDKASAIGKATFSGTQTLYNALGEESGSGELKGTLTASPSGTYGVKTGSTVETKWTDANKNLSEDGKLTLNGTFSFSGADGGVSCTATIKLLLESSTVEEEEPEGSVESFTVSSPAGCDVTGGYKTTCGTNSISKVEQTGTATLTATEEDFTISGLVLDYKFSSCAITTLRVEGSPTVSVSTPSSISSATFSAGALEVFNAESETTDTASAGGSPTASPSGTFQLVSNHEEETETAETAHEAATHEEETTEGPPPSGDQWINPETGEPIEGSQEFEASGGMTTEALGGAFKTGPATIHFQGAVYNEEEMGHGEIVSAQFTGPIATNLPGCQVNSATSSASGENPWTLTLEEPDNFSIENITFIYHYSGGCTAYGIPAEVKVSGTLTGTDENVNTTSSEPSIHEVCLTLSKSGDLVNEATSGSITFSTSGTGFCLPNLTTG